MGADGLASIISSSSSASEEEEGLGAGNKAEEKPSGRSAVSVISFISTSLSDPALCPDDEGSAEALLPVPGFTPFLRWIFRLFFLWAVDFWGANVVDIETTIFIEAIWKLERCRNLKGQAKMRARSIPGC